MLRLQHFALLTLTLLLPNSVFSQCTDDTASYETSAIPDYFFPFKGDTGDETLEDHLPDQISPKIDIPRDFPFFYQNQRTLHVSENGLISFGSPLAGQKETIDFPKETLRFVAPFWSDIDIRKNNGAVYYRATTESAILQRISEEVRERFVTSSKFTASWALIATWENVTHAEGDCTTKVNTFQTVLTTDGRYSFVFLLYARLDWLRAGNSDPFPIVGLNMNGDSYHELIHSGSGNARKVGTMSNIGKQGYWILRVDEKVIVHNACGADSNILRPSPMLASPRGGTRLLLSGPCLNADMMLKAKIAGTVVPATYINKYMAEVFSPPLYYQGKGLVELSIDNGTTYQSSATITIIDDHQVLPGVNRKDPISWDDVTVTGLTINWDKTELHNTEKVNIYFSTLKTATDDVEEKLYQLLDDEDNDGEAVLDLESLDFIPDDNLELVIHGAILVRGSNDTTGSKTQLYSDIHVATWFVGAFLNELAYRNRRAYNANNSATMLQEAIWEKIDVYFTDAENDEALRPMVRNALKNMVSAILNAIGTMKCNDWEKDQEVLTGLMSPPCTMKQAESDPRWVLDPYCRNGVGALCHHYSMKTCIIQAIPNNDGTSQRACYDGEGFIIKDRSASGTTAVFPLVAHPDGLAVKEDGKLVLKRKWQVDHLQADVEPQLFCCMWVHPDKSCPEFSAKRPIGTCDDYKYLSSGGVGGDPHYQTFDGLWYAFNGVGEYILSKHAGGFEVQVRHIKTESGSKAAAILQAAAIKTEGSDIIVIEVVSSRIKVYFDSIAQDLGCCSVLHFKGGRALLNMSEPQPTSVNITFDEGEKVHAMLVKDSLQLVIVPNITFKDSLVGLLGNYDGMGANDLKPQPGGELSASASPARIHDDFGESWRTTEDESLFEYPNGKQHSDYQDTEFTPAYPSPDITEPVPAFCQGNKQCAFDYYITEDEDFAKGTLAFIHTLDEYHADFASGRQCPTFQLGSLATLSTTRRWVNTIVTIKCIHKYDLHGSATRTCQRDGSWSGLETSCIPTPVPCDQPYCENNGTCMMENDEAVCHCRDGYDGERCEKNSVDTLPYIIIGVVAGGIAFAGLVIGCILFLRCRPKEEPLINEYKYKYPFGGRDSLPLFRGTLANRSGYFGQEYQNRGYGPYNSARKDPNYEWRPKFDRTMIRSPPIPPSPYPHFGSSQRGSIGDSSIDRIYNGEVPPKYRQEPVPDYDREYSSHIEASRLGPPSRNRPNAPSYSSKPDSIAKRGSNSLDDNFMFGTTTGRTETKQFGGY